MQHILNILELHQLHLVSSISDQVRHLYAAGLHLIQIYHWPHGYRDGIQRYLLVRDLGPRCRRASCLDESADTFLPDTENCFFTESNLFDIRYMRQPVGRGLRHLIDSERYELRQLIFIVRRGISRKVGDQPRGLGGLIRIDAIALSLSCNLLNQLGIPFYLDIVHFLCPSSLHSYGSARRGLHNIAHG